MPVAFTCPNPACGRTSRLPDEAVGKRVKCPACGHTSAAPSATIAPKTTDDGSRRATAVSAVPVEKVGRFVVRGKLGEGAFGAVYRAYDPQLDREVALKVPHAAVLDSPKRVERFLREAKAAANLRHPHIVPVFDAGSDGGRHYIASAFIDGQKLADAVEASDGGLDIDRAARLVRELAEALAYAHEQGIVHRDVKPDNVMLDRSDRVHLMDFGLASRQDAEARLTNDGAVMGTPSYMAPEQARGDTTAVGPAADQYACGVVLYELLTGRTPFAGPIPVVLHNQIHTDPPPPTTLRRAIPKDLETVCLMAMNKRPEGRYASCRELADDLRRWQEGEPVSVRPLNTAEKVVRWVRKHPAAAGLMAAGVLVIGLLAVTAALAVLGVQAMQARDVAKGEKVKADEARDREVEQRTAAETARDQLQVEQQKTAAAKDEAVAARKTAEDNEQLAKEKQTQAEKAEGEATKAKVAETEARKQVEEQSKKVVAVEYGRAMQMALQELRDDNSVASRTVVADSDKALRGWEWRYLTRLNDSSLLTVPGYAEVKWNSDGTRIFTTSANGTAHCWDVKTGKEAFPAKKLDGRYTFHSWSPDGTQLLANSPDRKSVKIWNMETGNEVSTLTDPTDNIGPATWSPDGTRVLASIGNQMTRVWDAKTGKEDFTLKGKNVPGGASLWSGDGLRFATSDPDDGTAKVWDAKTGAELHSLKGHNRGGVVWNIACNPDGTKVVTVDSASAVRVWDVKDETVLYTLPSSAVTRRAVCWSPDGSRIATGGENGTVRVWDASNGRELIAMHGHSKGVIMISWSRDGSRLATVDTGMVVKVWSATVPPDVQVFTQPKGVSRLTVTADGPKLDTAVVTTKVQVADWVSGVMNVKMIDYTVGPNTRVAWNPDGTRFVSARRLGFELSSRVQPQLKPSENPPTVWDVTTGKEVFTLKGHEQGAVAIAWSPDGTKLATGSFDKTAKVWDAKTGKVLHSLEQHAYTVSGLAWSRDGTKLVTASYDGRAKVWDASTWKLISTVGVQTANTPDGPVNGLKGVAWNKDDTQFVTAGPGATAKVWDAATGKELLVLKGHTLPVNAVAWSPDGTRIATGSLDGYEGLGGDGTVRVWDAVTGAEVLKLKVTKGTIDSVSWSADGSILISEGYGGTVQDGMYEVIHVWDTRKRDIVRNKPEAKK